MSNLTAKITYTNELVTVEFSTYDKYLVSRLSALAGFDKADRNTFTITRFAGKKLVKGEWVDKDQLQYLREFHLSPNNESYVTLIFPQDAEE